MRRLTFAIKPYPHPYCYNNFTTMTENNSRCRDSREISHMRIKIGFRTWIKVSLQYLILIPTLVYSLGVFRFPAFYNIRYEKWRSLKMQSNLQTIVNKLTSTNTLSRNQQRSIAHTRSNAWSKTFAIALSLVSVNLNFTRWSANRNELYIN